MAVDHLNFTIEKGQIYGFLGPNGAGKSTTMNIMTGYLGATEGEVLINGHNILTDPHRAKQDIGYLPEQPPLYMDMTVTEYLEFVFALKMVDKKLCVSQLEQIMHLVKLDAVKDRLIKNLSKGYRQRVGLAAALAGFPEIIILDEPTVGLDPQQIIEIRQLIRSLSKDHTVILSSHILSEVQEICDHIMIIYQGRLVASDTTENLEAHMRGKASIELTVKGNAPGTEAVLRQLPHIEDFSLAPSEEDGCTAVSLTAEPGHDIREDLFRAFAGRDLPLLKLTAAGTTLEDIFLKLTSDDRASAKTFQKDKEDSADESNL